MRTRFAFLSALFLLFIGQVVFAQVTGTVEDANGFPVADAEVVVRGAGTSAVTDENGSFSVDAKIGDVLIVTDLMGVTQEFNVSKTNLGSLKFGAPVELQTVTLLGGIKVDPAQKVGAYTVINKEDFELTPVASVDEVLNGRVAGLNFSSNGGQPGSSTIIALRGVGSLIGTTNPLYVIDGVIVGKGSDNSLVMESFNPLSSIDPNQIENVQVLKDASSTSLYGARGANGVIVITTKRGKYNQKTRFNLSSDIAIQDIAYDKSKWMNAQEFLQWGGLTYYNSGDYSSMADAVTAFTEDSHYDGFTDSDWRDAVMRNNATVRTYNFSATGGGENTSFRLGGSYYQNKPLVEHGKYDRIGISSSINHKVSDKFTLSFVGNFSNTENHTYPSGGAFANPWLTQWTLAPIIPVYNEDGSLNQTNLPGLTQGFNPLGVLEKNFQDGSIKTFVSSISGDLHLTKDMSFNSLFGTQYQTVDEKLWWDPSLGDGAQYNGYLYESRGSYWDWNWVNTLAYKKIFAEKHNLEVYGGMEYQEHKARYMVAQGMDFEFIQEPYLSNATDQTTFGIGGNIEKWIQMSYFSRLNYSFDNKYSVTGQIRYDANSTLGNIDRSGIFWSVGGSWNLGNETFMPEVFSTLILRGNYGESGNIPYADSWGSSYNAVALIGNTSYGAEGGLTIIEPGNPALTWEVSKQMNVGLDFGILRDALKFSVEVYNKKTSATIMPNTIVPTTPTPSGATTYMANIGDLQNKGFEVELTARPINKEFKWTLSGNFSYNRSEVLSAPDPEAIYFLGAMKGIKVGQQIAEYYTYGWAGVDPANGDNLWYTDDTESATTNDINEATQYFQNKTPFPLYMAGLKTEFFYKGVSLSAYFTGQFEYSVYDRWSSYVYNDGFYDYFNQTTDALYNSWTEDNPNADYPRQTIGGVNSEGQRYNVASTRYLRDGDHIRLKELKLAYSFGDIFKKATGIDNLTVYVKGVNMWTYVFDDKLTFDPESNSNAYGYSWQGKGVYDYTSPLMKSYSLGVSIDF